MIPNISCLPQLVKGFKNILFNLDKNPLYLFEYDLSAQRDVVVENRNHAFHGFNELRELRYGFLHLSASGKIGMRASANGKRVIIDDI